MPANITLAQLRVLVTVVDRGGFTAAAQVLGMTQSGVSQAVQSLEDAVSVALLSRGRDGVEPTEIGRVALAEASAALAAVDRFRQHCASWAGLDSGTLRIGSVASAASRLLPPKLRNFKIRYPRIEIVLLEGSDAEISDWVLADVVEIGLTAYQPSDLRAELVAEDDFIAVVGRQHRFSKRRSISIADLAEEPFIMSGSGCEPAIRAFFVESGRNPQVAFTVRDMTTLFEMVRQGLGVTIVPSLSLPSDQTDLRVVGFAPARRRNLLAVTRSSGPLSPAADAFLSVLRQSECAANERPPSRRDQRGIG